jgi:putative FmdB family regulatory protein
MPLYEYECDACGHTFERIQKFSDSPVEVCPECGGKIHKLVSAPAIQFKGSGWYVTDYARRQPSDDTPPAADGQTSDSKQSSAKDAGAAEGKGSTSEVTPAAKDQPGGSATEGAPPPPAKPTKKEA